MMLAVWGCSTQKDRWINRSYHNTTAHYNGYFNARELLKEADDMLTTQYVEDYTKLLPIYIYGDEVTSKNIYPQMDTAIKKTAVVINRHAMPNPGYADRHKISESDVVDVKVKIDKEEWCQWIDDNWLLMGVSNFMKRDFERATSQFTYVAKEYRLEDIRFDAMVWLFKTHIEEEDFTKAEKILKLLDEAQLEAEELEANKKELKKIEKAAAKKERKKRSKRRKSKSNSRNKKKKKKSEEEVEKPFPSRLVDDLCVAKADYFIRQEKYDEAIEYLEKSIELTKKKKFRTRLIFILAQLYEQTDNKTKASEYYTKVIKSHPEYEMEFYATINRALNVNARAANYREIKGQLKQMLRDEKNVQYYDQLHYALAKIELKEPNEKKAIEHFVLSTETSVDNTRQKGVSFLALADIYFGHKDYPVAQQYYDSCSSFLPKDYENYDQISAKAEYLTDLITHLHTVYFADSVQKIAAMTDAERNVLIDDLIQAEVEAEEEARIQAEQDRLLSQEATQVSQGGNNSGNWYFYNPTARGLGFADFRKTWGGRKLEDNWRRKDKNQSISSFDVVDDLEDGEDGEDGEGGVSAKSREHYTKNLPLTAALLTASHEKIVEALYSAGIIYKEKLLDNTEAIGSFTDLVERYDTCKYQLPTYYQLYLLHGVEGNPERQQYFKDKLSQYPESEYWLIISNPSYKKDAEKQRIQDEARYNTTYELYQQRRYPEVLVECNDVVATQPENFFIKEYYFLKALVAGRLQQMDVFEAGMTTVVQKFSGTDIGNEAQDYLNKLHNIAPDVAEDDGPTYTFNAPEPHYYILIFPQTPGKSITSARTAISNFNSTYFSVEELNTSASFFDVKNKIQVILVKSFDNAKKAKDYYIAFETNDNIVKDINKAFEFYTVSQSNYPLLYQQKDFAEYKAFYEENYLEKP
jgi:hypothetical protein